MPFDTMYLKAFFILGERLFLTDKINQIKPLDFKPKYLLMVLTDKSSGLVKID